MKFFDRIPYEGKDAKMIVKGLPPTMRFCVNCGKKTTHDFNEYNEYGEAVRVCRSCGKPLVEK